MRLRTPGLVPLLLLLFVGLHNWGCRKVDPEPHGYPEDIGEILVTNCAIVACHDQNSFVQEGRLSLETWEQMFQGSRAGAAVVPFRTDQSYLLFFINRDPNLGIVQEPSMPLNGTPLSAAEYLKVQDWIASGAPDENGNVKWADDPNRSKIYIANQGCDQVSVMDRETRLVMRYVDIGKVEGLVEAPHYLKVSPDGRYWYTVFLAINNTIEKYDAVTDQLVGRAPIPDGSWNTFDISPDGRYAFAVDYVDGIVSVVDLETLTEAYQINVGSGAHGSTLKKDLSALYVTNQDGDELHKVVLQDVLTPDFLETIDLEGNVPRPIPLRAMGPHEVKFTPDGSRYLVTCQYQGQVRIFDAANDSLIQVINVGADPVELDFSVNPPYAFVTCMEDTVLNAGDPLKRGSVAVIDYNSMTLVSEVYTGYQPHGIAVDQEKGLVYVGNRNSNPNGPAPHHSTDCGGRNGSITAIDINTLTLLPGFRHELSVDPYNIAIRY